MKMVGTKYGPKNLGSHPISARYGAIKPPPVDMSKEVRERRLALRGSS